jgi:hypothetical protein
MAKVLETPFTVRVRAASGGATAESVANGRPSKSTCS